MAKHTQASPARPAPAERNNNPKERLVNEAFRRCACASARFLGSSWAFILAFGVIVVWAATGPIFHFSDTWQLVINTGTTIVTFLMVFLIQNTQNRDAKAIHLKLDELIFHLKGARNSLINIESLSDEQIQKLEEQFERIRKAHTHGTENADEHRAAA